MYKDYKTETKSYLKQIGREDAIDRVVPKTAKVNRVFEMLYREVISLLCLCIGDSGRETADSIYHSGLGKERQCLASRN